MNVAEIHKSREVEPYRWTVDEYQKLGEDGFFRDRRVELLNGQIYEMSPLGYRHATPVARVSKRFTLKARERYDVRTQSPFILGERSMPEPDVSLVDIVSDSLPHLPKTENVYLATEVSDSTLGFDRGHKKDAYALRGIPEYWLLNLQENVMEIYRDPSGDRYQNAETVSSDGFFSPLAFPDLKLRVADFIP